MNENIDWYFVNGNVLFGLVFINYVGFLNRTSIFYCLVIRKRKI